MRTLLVAFFAVAACGGEEGRVAPVGSSCTAQTGCGDDLECNTNLPNGYCTTPCTTPGATTECPGENSVCDSVQQTMICVQLCTSETGCRAGFACNGVSGSNLKACKPQ